MSELTTDPVTRWEAMLPLLDSSRSGLRDPAGEFLRALATFVVLEQCEREESELEAIASFDDQEYRSTLPQDLRWSRIADAPTGRLGALIKEVIDRLRGTASGPVTRYLGRIHACYQPSPDTEAIQEAARRLVVESDLSTARGRRDLADLYESIIARYIETASYTGEFASDEHLVRLVVDLAAPRLGERVYDPCFGLGGFLSESARRMIIRGESLPPAGWRELRENSIFGVEINPSAWLIGLARVMLAGISHPNLELSNTLERPLPRDRSAEGFDVIVANLPFGGSDPSAGEHFRIKTASRESLFLQHILGHLRLGGRAVIVVPHGVLFRHGADEQIRKQMLEEFHVDAVISLPAGWLKGTSIRAGILCVSRQEPAKEVVFVGECLWDEGLEADGVIGSRRGLLMDAIHHRQGVLTLSQAQALQARHLDRVHLDHVDTFDEFNPENGYVTSAGDSERFRDYLEKMDLIHLLPTDEKPKRAERNLKPLPKLHGVHMAWTVPSANIAHRHWELVPKETGESAVEDLLRRIQLEHGSELRRICLADVAEVLGGVGYDKSGVVDTDLTKKQQILAGRDVGDAMIKASLDSMGLVPLVRVQDIGKERSDVSTAPSVQRPAMFLNEKGMERVGERHRLRVGDLLLTASGTVGSFGLVPEALAGAVPAKSVIVIRSLGAFSSLALLRLLQSAPYQDWIKGSASGSVIQHLSVRVLKQMPLLAFTAEQQKRLAQELRESSDVDTVLKAFSALSGESVWVSLLLNNTWVQVLTKAGKGKGYSEEWWDALRRFVLLITKANESANQAATRDVFHQSLLSWVHHALDLLDAMDLPPGMERYGALQSWDKWAIHELLPAKDRMKDVNPDQDLAGRAADRFAGLCEVLLDAADTEANRVAALAALSIEIANPILDAGRPAEIEVVLRNTGVAPFRKLNLRAESIDASHSIALLSGGSASRWPCSVPAHSAGEAALHIDWEAHLINGEAVAGSAELAVSYRSLRVIAERDALGVNPYITGTPIKQQELFFGREDVIGKIRRMLRLDGPSTVILLEGNRRAGKTSVLRRLQVLGTLPGWIPAYLSFQGIGGDSAKAGFSAQNLFREMTSVLVEATTLSKPTSTPDLLAPVIRASGKLERKKRIEALVDSIGIDRPFEQFREILEACLESVRPLHVVLMLDEFDKIQEAIDNGVLSPNIPENIRFLFHHYDELSGILTGSRRIKRLREEYWSALFGIGKRIGVSSLDEASARALVTRPVAGRLVYSESAVGRILLLCARQPFLLQCVALEVFQQCAEQNQTNVTVEIVDAAADRVVQSFEQFEALFRDHLGTERRRFLACLIHQLTREQKRLRLTFDLLQSELEQRGIEYRRAANLKADLEELRELEVIAIEKESDATFYRMEVPLFTLWLEKNVDCRSHLEAARIEEELS